MGANGASGGYNLENSLRFRSSASAYLSRTFPTAGNRQTWTWSGWVKRGTLGANQCLLGTGTGSSYFDQITINSSDALGFITYNGGVTSRKETTQVLRDPSAWYHIVCVYDTTNVTADDRMRMYINGERVTDFLYSTNPALNYSSPFLNTAILHTIGRLAPATTYTNYLDGYQTEVNFVDGQALTASDFGETNSTTGVWQPIEYTGSYGTNGFYLPMNKTVETYDATYLVVAGGGSGSSYMGGGGAGGFLTGTSQLIPDNTYDITVGSGGAAVGGGGAGIPGGNSVFNSITAIGGGRGGGGVGGAGGSGGGGGGGGGPLAGGAGTAGQGFAGGTMTQGGGSSLVRRGGGGGGASEVGANSGTTAGDGGDGLASSITGTSTYYAGGGGGGYDARGGGAGGAGGLGGGGAGVAQATAGSGTPNTGSGGGGSGYSAGYGTSGAGGSGIVILRVPTAKYTGTVTGSPTVTTDGSDTVIQFTANGTYTA